MIDLLQTYFGMAIRNNCTDLQVMARACWAALMHKVAFPDDTRRHKYCPEGKTSWRGWQSHRAESGGAYVPRDSIPVAVLEVIKPIWMQLTDKTLLRKCLRGATQNRNEAWNGMLWGMCPKTKFVGSEVVQLSAALSYMRFNHSSCMYGKVLEEMAMKCGKHTLCALQKIDDRRIHFAEKKATEGSTQFQNTAWILPKYLYIQSMVV